MHVHRFTHHDRPSSPSADSLSKSPHTPGIMCITLASPLPQAPVALHTSHMQSLPSDSFSLQVVTGERGRKRLGKVTLPRPLGTPTCGSAGGEEYSVTSVVTRQTLICIVLAVPLLNLSYVRHVNHKDVVLRHNNIDFF